MPITSVSILSASAAANLSAPVVLDYLSGKPVMWWATVASSVGTGDFTVQFTLDDIQITGYSTVYPQTGSPTTPPSTAAIWGSVSSGPYTTVTTSGSVGVHFSSSSIFPDGVYGFFPSPPCALRLSASATSSCPITLKVVQGTGG